MRGWIVVGCVVIGMVGCGGDADDGQGGGDGTVSGLPLPAPGGSRWSALERDGDADGLAETITRFEYDSLGRRTLQTTWRAEGGVAVGEATEVQRWTYDSASRVLVHAVQDDHGEQQTEATYGADGLLATTVRRSTEAGVLPAMHYAWENMRLVQAAEADGWPAYRVVYGADGRVQRVERRFDDSAAADVDIYEWRTDGQLSRAEFGLAVGNLVMQNLMYDDEGRLRRSTLVDDGIDEAMARHAHDARGRLERIEWDLQPVSLDEADFVADTVYLIHWEEGLCQPVHALGLPPTFDRRVTVLARADGATVGCAD